MKTEEKALNFYDHYFNEILSFRSFVAFLSIFLQFMVISTFKLGGHTLEELTHPLSPTSAIICLVILSICILEIGFIYSLFVAKKHNKKLFFGDILVLKLIWILLACGYSLPLFVLFILIYYFIMAIMGVFMYIILIIVIIILFIGINYAISKLILGGK